MDPLSIIEKQIKVAGKLMQLSVFHKMADALLPVHSPAGSQLTEILNYPLVQVHKD